MKYKLFRSFGSLDRDVRKHELVAVEYGASILDVEGALIKAAADDLAEDHRYIGYATSAYSPEPVCFSGMPCDMAMICCERFSRLTRRKSAD